MIRMVTGPNNRQRRSRPRSLRQVPQRHAERARDAERHCECWIGLVPLDLAEHGAADARGVRERIQGPAALSAKLLQTQREMIPASFERFRLAPGLDDGWVHGNKKA